jgi:argininosuccinate lyase
VVDTLHNTPFADINDSEASRQMRGYQALDEFSRVAALLVEIVKTMDVDDERVSCILETSCCTFTELADTLAREEGISFRQGHTIASKAASHVLGQR